MTKITETERFKHVLSSLKFCSQALNELKILTTKFDLEIVNQLIRHRKRVRNQKI